MFWGTEEFVPGFLLLPCPGTKGQRDKEILSWDKGTTERPVPDCPGTSRPLETLVWSNQVDDLFILSFEIRKWCHTGHILSRISISRAGYVWCPFRCSDQTFCSHQIFVQFLPDVSYCNVCSKLNDCYFGEASQCSKVVHIARKQLCQLTVTTHALYISIFHISSWFQTTFEYKPFKKGQNISR